MRLGTNKTAYEIWKGKKSNFSYFHVFECTYYILNDREHLGKFQAKCDKGIFLSDSLNSRAYRIYNLRIKTIMESINVVVDDIAEISSEDEPVCLTDQAKSQLQNAIVAPSVATEKESECEIESSVETTSIIELMTKKFDITDPTTKDPPTRI